MSNGRGSDDTVGYFVAACIVVIALIILQFSKAIGVDFSTGFNVFFRLCLVAGVCGFAMKLDVPFIAIAPALVAGMLGAFFPAFDYWAYGSSPMQFEVDNAAWWARWYVKVACIFVPMIFGYGYLYRRHLR